MLGVSGRKRLIVAFAYSRALRSTLGVNLGEGSRAGGNKKTTGYQVSSRRRRKPQPPFVEDIRYCRLLEVFARVIDCDKYLDEQSIQSIDIHAEFSFCPSTSLPFWFTFVHEALLLRNLGLVKISRARPDLFDQYTYISVAKYRHT